MVAYQEYVIAFPIRAWLYPQTRGEVLAGRNVIALKISLACRMPTVTVNLNSTLCTFTARTTIVVFARNGTTTGRMLALPSLCIVSHLELPSPLFGCASNRFDPIVFKICLADNWQNIQLTAIDCTLTSFFAMMSEAFCFKDTWITLACDD